MILVFYIALTGASCIQNPASKGIDMLLPQLHVYWPKTNDTISFGRQEIQYSIDNPGGVASYELFVNDSSMATFTNTPAGAQPKIFWQIDASELHNVYTYQLKATDIDGAVTTSEKFWNISIGETRSLPSAPYNLKLLRLSASVINLQWDDSIKNASFYELWRKQGENAYVKLKTLPANSISTNDEGLLLGVRYRYRVRSVNENGYRESNEVTTVADSNQSGVAAPGNLHGTPLRTNVIELQWVDNSSNELAFIVQRRVTSASTFTDLALVGPNQTTFLDSVGLFASSSYTYRVAAKGQFGQSAWSNEETVITPYQDVNPPTSLTAIYSLTSHSAVLTWSDNTVLEIETRVERKTANGPFIEIGKVGVDITTYADSTVVGGNAYSYRVRAYTVDQRFSAYSNEAPITIPLGANRLPGGFAR